MQSTRCLFSPARALRRVFLEQPTPTTASQQFLPSNCYYYYYLSPRLFTTSSARSRLLAPSGSQKSKPNAEQKPKGGNSFPFDDAIPYKYVRLAPAEGGELSAPQRRADVLAKLDLSKYRLQMVALPPPPKEKPSDGEQGEDDWLAPGMAEPAAPVCRIVDKMALRRKAADKAKEARTKEVKRKEMELNWAIAGHDLEYKLRQLRAFLGKGLKVEVMLAKKRHGRTASAEEGRQLVESLREVVAEVGAKETKNEGQFPGVVKLTFEGKAQG